MYIVDYDKAQARAVVDTLKSQREFYRSLRGLYSDHGGASKDWQTMQDACLRKGFGPSGFVEAALDLLDEL